MAYILQVFIDFTTFDFFSKDFWNQGIGPKLAKVVNSIPSAVNPVIRLIAGGPFHSDARFKDPKTPTDEKQAWTLFRDLFWPGSIPLINHPRAMLYLGYYNPDLKAFTIPNALSAWALKFETGLGEYLSQKTQIPAKALSYFDNGFLNGLNFPGLPTISWNHAKIVAVNGARMTTGGNNLWDDYGNQKTNIFDSAVKTQGDATIQAHQYLDTLSR